MKFEKITTFWENYLNILSKQLHADVTLITDSIIISSDLNVKNFCNHVIKYNSCCLQCLHNKRKDKINAITCQSGITSLLYSITLPEGFYCSLMIRFKLKNNTCYFTKSILNDELQKEFNLLQELDYIEYTNLKQTIEFLKDNILPLIIQSQSNKLLQNNSTSPFLTNNLLNAKEIVFSIAKQMYNDPCQNYSLEEFAQTFYFSKSYLSEEFKKYIGISFTHFLNEMRLNKSLALLAFTKLSVAKIASLVGFSDSNYFYRKFKNETGITPSEFRQYSQKIPHNKYKI